MIAYQNIPCQNCGHEQQAPADPQNTVVCSECGYHIIEPEPSYLPEYQ